MIWYLLTSMRKKTDSQTTVLCVVGKEKGMFSVALYPIFVYWIFYSGITPSATGGRPVQPFII